MSLVGSIRILICILPICTFSFKNNVAVELSERGTKKYWVINFYVNKMVLRKRFWTSK